MAKNRERLAALLGAKIVGEIPDVGGGAFGMARLAQILHARLTPSEGERPGRPTDPNWVVRPKVPMSEATADRLARLAEEMSTPDRKVSPMQLAARLLEEALDEITRVTQCYPYFLQEWGYQAWNLADECPISVETVQRATQESIARLDQNFFRVRFDRLTPREKDYLRALALWNQYAIAATFFYNPVVLPVEYYPAFAAVPVSFYTVQSHDLLLSL